MSCRLSGNLEGVQVAHIVPQAELAWWRTNDMSVYNTSETPLLNDKANALLLRADLHVAFIKRHIVFVPKPASDSGDMRLVAHIWECSPELEHLYHNRELYPMAVGVEMLYARLAWSVLSRLKAFLLCNTDRRLELRVPTERPAPAGDGFVTAASCELLSATAAKKQTPKKRKPYCNEQQDFITTSSRQKIKHALNADTPSSNVT
ncbi:hypothetical protein PTT_10599 [Pyrenophora teres f. teres 0-1]|uniref:HNH nuclease domain-containing protein n=1 Tax=Pyrenophora teres f. teres (strain 0-1) TaxID=861557 RepID=E3RPL9_PYRTT|nr:hypothetical protein PTT_10599 [Pyrenophora teres f. teres 0-1]